VLQNIIGRKKLMPQNLLAARDKRNETDSEKLWQWSYDRDLVTWSHEMRGKWEKGVCSPRYCAKILHWKRYLCRLCMSQMRIMERIFNVFRTGANGRWAFVRGEFCLPSAEFSPFLIFIPVVGFVCEEPTCLDQSLTVTSPCWLVVW